MARSPEEIKLEIGQNFVSNQYIKDVYELSDNAVFQDEFSVVSLENILFSIIAIAIWTLEVLFDNHSKQVDTALYEQKSGTGRWYRKMSMAFQYGFNLLPDDDKFNNTGYTEDQINASKIIKYCSISEGTESSQVVIKIAGETSNNLHELTDSQLNSFTSYMKEISYAGVKLKIVNNPADKLYLLMHVYIDPLIFNADGMNILTGEKTVELAITKYIKNLPFDGNFIINDLIAYLRDINGVNNVNIIQAQSSFLENGIYRPFVTINVSETPFSGYFEIEPTSMITYVV